MIIKAQSRSFLFLAMFLTLMLGWQEIIAAPGGKQHGGKISRAQFATKMDQREPYDDVIFVDDTAKEIFFFTEVLYMTGHQVTHRWEFEGKEVSRVTFDIGGPRWRIFSRKTLDEGLKGRWEVLVTDEKGWPLTSKIFVFGQEYKNKYLDKIMHDKQEEGSNTGQIKQDNSKEQTEEEPSAGKESSAKANKEPSAEANKESLTGKKPLVNKAPSISKQQEINGQTPKKEVVAQNTKLISN